MEGLLHYWYIINMEVVLKHNKPNHLSLNKLSLKMKEKIWPWWFVVWYGCLRGGEKDEKNWYICFNMRQLYCLIKCFFSAFICNTLKLTKHTHTPHWPHPHHTKPIYFSVIWNICIDLCYCCLLWEGFCSSLFIFLLKKKNGGMITSVMKNRKFKRCECCWTHLRVKFIKGRCECAYYHTGVFKEMCRREHWCSHDIYRPVIYIEPSVSKRIWTEITVHTPQKKSIWTRLKDDGQQIKRYKRRYNSCIYNGFVCFFVY